MNISFVILEYNCCEDVNNCMRYIRTACRDVSYEVIVPSNSCYTLEKQENLIRDSGDVRWLFNEANLGFAAGMNRGISASAGDFVVIINADVAISGSIHQALKYLTENSDVGALGPKIMDCNGNVQDSCREFMTPQQLLARIWKRYWRRNNVILTKAFDYDAIQPVDWVIGAFIMIRRDVLKRVGLLDEAYFLYVEDMDWCKRIWINGYKVAYYPLLVVKYQGDRKSVSGLALRKNPVNKHAFIHATSYFRFLRKFSFSIHNSNCKGTSQGVV